MKNKKGNVGVIVLGTLLFVVVIAMTLYIAYDKLYVKDNGDVSGGNQNNEQQGENEVVGGNVQQEDNKYKINSLAEASDLVEKYHYYAFGVKNYLVDMDSKELVAFRRADISGAKTEADIKSTASYADKETQLAFAEFVNGSADYYSYENVQKAAKELFGSSATVEKKTYINCSNSYFYVKEYDGFVKGNIACGGGSFSEQLQVYNFENVGETLYIYANFSRIYTENNMTEYNRKEAYKYTFKLQSAGYYLVNVEKI